VSGLGTGGMYTKLQAANLARRSGCAVVISNGKYPERICDIVHGKPIGTKFTPLISKMESRKRYMLAEARNSEGALEVDAGAIKALKSGGSLLPVGIVGSIGNFQRADIVHVVDKSKKNIALGMVNYSSVDLEKIIGLQSNEIEQVLGYTYGMEVIHHNNLLFI
jgi:glutamate 5-kinase